MKRFILILLLIFTTGTFLFAQIKATTKHGKKVWLYENGKWCDVDSIVVKNIGLAIPKIKPNDVVIEHLGYTLSYNKKYGQSNWVAYALTKQETVKVTERADQFKPDPKVKTGTATNIDYLGTGYDRGHLAPAADMGWDKTVMAESFYYSNMSPQKPSFNRGIWKKLEEQVRNWSVQNEVVYIVTAPVLTSGLDAIGPNKVAVPKYFCKVILNFKEYGSKGIGFIIPNEGSKALLQHFAVSIDSVEKFTGIDFFPALPDEQEEAIESRLAVNEWNWTSSSTGEATTFKKAPQQNKENHVSTIKERSFKIQCTAITKDGIRCKNKTTNLDQRCYLHQKT